MQCRNKANHSPSPFGEGQGVGPIVGWLVPIYFTTYFFLPMIYVPLGSVFRAESMSMV